MKKLLKGLGISLLALSLVACSGNTNKPNPSETPSVGGDVTNERKELVIADSSEVSNMDYVQTALAVDHEINVNLVDGLLEHDAKGNLVGSIAESWSSNEDATVWTFKIREGVKWVTSLGEEYADVTAHDFVTGLRHGAEFDSGTAWLLMGVIEGYSEYMASDFSDEEFAKVGVKAIDDYTLEFTMEIKEDGTGTPIPYFASMTTYAVLYPINETFLESKGTGCVLGTPDNETCDFGSVSPDSILYNGAYLLESVVTKSQTVLVENKNYWDPENVHVEKVTIIYDDGSDPYSIMNGFEQGTYTSASLNPTWADYADYASKYENNTYFTTPNSYVFGMVFNYNRQAFEYTNYADDATLRQNTRDAILNTNFRLALSYSLDRVSWLAVRSPLELATATLRNIDNVASAGMTSDGKNYYDLVEAAYTELTGNEYQLDDGQTPFYNPDMAMQYIEKAKADGVKFPIHLDMLVVETSDSSTKQGQSLKQSIEASTQNNIIIELVFEDQDTVEAIAYDNNDPAASDYDISTFSGWGPDYQDPKSFVDIYSPTTGYYMTTLGLGTTEDVDGDGTLEVSDLEIKETIGLMEYEELYRAADAITDDLDARYAAFAKADAYLLANALYIPTSQQARGQNVSYITPFTKMHSDSGTDQYKYKLTKLQTEMVTAEEFAAAEAAWRN